MKVTCVLCPHHCALEEGQTGLCKARGNRAGTVVCLNYGQISGIALDPIEKKPLRHFFPGSKILSVGSYGCNLCCPFCQNSEISMARSPDTKSAFISPEALVQKAAELISKGNIGLAYTYNEPLIGYEYVRDCAVLTRGHGMKNVLVTNGMICGEPLTGLLPRIDAANIDLKAFTQKFYSRIGGDLETVKQTIKLASTHIHVEVTTLIIPGENDSEAEIEKLSSWLSAINPEIPLHISRFFPHFKMTDRGPTPVDTIYSLADIARKHLRFVYTGNC